MLCGRAAVRVREEAAGVRRCHQLGCAMPVVRAAAMRRAANAHRVIQLGAIGATPRALKRCNGAPCGLHSARRYGSAAPTQLPSRLCF